MPFFDDILFLVVPTKKLGRKSGGHRVTQLGQLQNSSWLAKSRDGARVSASLFWPRLFSRCIVFDAASAREHTHAFSLLHPFAGLILTFLPH